jgi:hypothetical protein
MVTRSSHYSIFGDVLHLLTLVGLGHERSYLLSFHWFDIEVQFLSIFLSENWHDHLVWSPFWKSVCLWHCKTKILTLVHDLIIGKLIYDVFKFIPFDILIVFMIIIEVEVTHHHAVLLILENDIESVFHLV